MSLGLLGLIGGVGTLIWVQKHLSSRVVLPSLLYIPKGSTKNAIAYIDSHYLPLSWIDTYLIKFYGYPQAGWIETGGGEITLGTFFQRLTHAKAALKEVTLVPGETTVVFLDQLATSLDLKRTRLEESYRKRTTIEEGLLFPETYQVPIGIDEEGIVDFLYRQSIAKHRELSLKYLGHYDEKEWFRTVVTTASVIQKEAGSRQEMPLVSAVIRNRLKRGMKLQMDGTLNYGRYSHQKITPRRIREDVTKFNTYKYQGLPDLPVCTVSEAAIEAAINPADVDYLYFVRGRDGRHRFSKRYKSHLHQIEKLKNGKN